MDVEVYRAMWQRPREISKEEVAGLVCMLANATDDPPPPDGYTFALQHATVDLAAEEIVFINRANYYRPDETITRSVERTLRVPVQFFVDEVRVRYPGFLNSLVFHLFNQLKSVPFGEVKHYEPKPWIPKPEPANV